ncbi:coiled-coil domain-containing protein 89-like isoform X2 [Ruditapes philippinarum]|uniref:coiled-coil domain-containing protein 89-like isoform X2 n=1 Tax=Ruditapes philippinarum TaxID=129788 RepID=UPI00295A94B8|nr:coiled-coil domain-containing protein 89-like isoform X2 [Ruditapes philippinarum]
MAGHRSPGGYGHMPSSNIRQAWYETDDQYSPTSRQRYTNNTNARHGREAGRQSQTTEQEMDVDSSDDTRREKMPMKNIEELFLKLEGLPTLIQNSKQEMREWKQLLSTRSSDETLKLKEEIEKLRMENQTLKSHHDRISSNRNDENVKALEQELQKAKQENEEYKNVNSKVIRKYQKAEEKIKRIEQTVAEDQRSIDKITRECESVKEQMSALQNRYQAAYDEKVKIGKELSESKSRLSRMMGNKLGDNNPDIADLSDKNRPTKLAEKNTELYDNEWTDAFEVFQTKYATEKETIEKLLQMLQDIKVECDQIAQEQVQKLTEAMKLKRSTQRIPDHIFKQLKDFRRFTAEESLPEVIEKCLHKVRFKDYQKFLRDEGVLKFFKGCVELCWFMNVQDPPLVFGHTPKKNDEFDGNYFKFYTSTGSKFEYMVWPALLLKENGAILSKGVAQASFGQKLGRKDQKTEEQKPEETVWNLVHTDNT